ncbi:MAG: cation transporter [Thermodesulfovibrionales bacterium]|jgi:divalent metal cation (Fe/Co/Zn/Cd) transporter
MEPILVNQLKGKLTFYKWASALALVTIFYNLLEGMVSVFFGFQDGTVTLFGFGVDSFVEVISGIGIWHMIRRMRQNGTQNHDGFERTALRVTGTAFYILSAGLIIIALINVYKGYKPETTFWGIIVSIISILSMWALIHYKVKIGTQFKSQALLSDANCSKICMWLSVILLISSAGYELTGLGLLDSLGALGIAVLSFREGREAFEKAKGNLVCSCQGKCH